MTRLSPAGTFPNPSKPGGSPISSLLLLGATGFGAMLFTLVAGFFVYFNTQNLVSAKDWVEHTQEVLSALQAAGQGIDRVEFGIRLYAMNRDQAQILSSRLSAIGLHTEARHIATLTSDNPAQTHEAQQLMACSDTLENTVRAAGGDAAAPPLPVEALFRCREAVSLMSEGERRLLKDRTRQSQHSSAVSLGTQCGCVALSLTILAGLFGLLLRDALLRRKSALQAETTNRDLASSVEALEARIHQARQLTACRDELQLCVTVQQVYRAAADCLARLLPGSNGALFIMDNSRRLIEGVSAWSVPGEHSPAIGETFTPDSCCGLRMGQPRWRKPGFSEINCTHFSGPAPARYLCLPLVAQGEALGVLTVECAAESVLQKVEEHMDGMQQLLQLTGMAVAALHLRTRLENQSIRDALTGLFNRHFMQITLERELARASRSETTLAICMLDVDHFKQFNDTYGHGAGDAMLQSIAGAFQRSVRSEDTVCRYGGEEFIIILPGITPESARLRAEGIREAVGELSIPLENGINGHATVSIGIASFPDDADDAVSLLRKADQALYRAKHEGRNQVRCAGNRRAELLTSI